MLPCPRPRPQRAGAEEAGKEGSREHGPPRRWGGVGETWKGRSELDHPPKWGYNVGEKGKRDASSCAVD